MSADFDLQHFGNPSEPGAPGHKVWIQAQSFDGKTLDPALDPEVQELAKVIAKVIHPSYKQTDHVFHRKALNTAVAVLKAGYRRAE
jgi:hypothetical protein